jgi:hypothetical protein
LLQSVVHRTGASSSTPVACSGFREEDGGGDGGGIAADILIVLSYNLLREEDVIQDQLE